MTLTLTLPDLSAVPPAAWPIAGAVLWYMLAGLVVRVWVKPRLHLNPEFESFLGRGCSAHSSWPSSCSGWPSHC